LFLQVVKSNFKAWLPNIFKMYGTMEEPCADAPQRAGWKRLDGGRMNMLRGLILVMWCVLAASMADARPLQKGSQGEDVKQWQLFLNSKGAFIPADGDFGPVTHRATREFQQRWKLDADGVAGPQTLRKATALGYRFAPRSTSRTKTVRSVSPRLQVKMAPRPVAPRATPSAHALRIESMATRVGQVTDRVAGTIVNTGGRRFENVQVEIELLNASGTRVGSTLASVSDFAPYASWSFEAPVLTEGATSYRVKALSAW
jgi:hypothetical protein